MGLSAKALLFVASIFLASLPVQGGDFETLRVQWAECLGGTIPKFAKISSEPADIVAEAVFGFCAEKERAVKQWMLTQNAGIFESMPADEADGYIAQFKQEYRSEMLARILIERSQ
jgi:hypothetical protein